MSPITKTKTARSDEWATPRWLFDHFNAEFGFTLDGAAQEWNAKLQRYNNGNGRDVPWDGETVWLNPPYSTDKLREFMAKAYQASQRGATVVCLVPCAPDTYWWTESVEGKASEIRHLTRSLLPSGRIHFEAKDQNGPAGRAGFASVLVVYRPDGSPTPAHQVHGDPA